jgi:hypothetical protein
MAMTRTSDFTLAGSSVCACFRVKFRRSAYESASFVERGFQEIGGGGGFGGTEGAEHNRMGDMKRP